MKILMVTNLYPPEARGGAEYIAQMMAEGLAAMDHEVSVVTTTRGRTGGISRTRETSVVLRRFRPALPYYLLDDATPRSRVFWRRVEWHLRDLLGGSSRRVVRAVIDEIQPDVVISHNLRGMGLRAASALHAAGVPWAHIVHDVQLLVPSGLQWEAERRPWTQWAAVTRPYQALTRAIISSPDVVVCPTRAVLDRHARSGFFSASRQIVLENPLVRTPRARPSGLRHDPFRLVYVGQLARHKGVHILLEAMRRLAQHRVTLDIVGDGPEMDELMEQALTLPDLARVSFLGRVPHERVLETLSTYDALVVPSLVVENCPGVILEARAAGLPIIASNVGGIPELIGAEGLVSPGEPRALAQAVYQCMQGVVPATRVSALSVPSYLTRLLAALGIDQIQTPTPPRRPR